MKTEITSCILPDYHRLKLDINNIKLINSCKQEISLLNEKQVKVKTDKENENFIEFNKMSMHHTQTYEHKASGSMRKVNSIKYIHKIIGEISYKKINSTSKNYKTKK